MSPILGIYASQISGHLVTNNYSSISTVTVGSGGTSSITFSSIPSTYSHLQVRAITRSNRTSDINDVFAITLNSDTTSGNYYAHILFGNGSSTGAFSSQTANGSAGMYVGLWQASSTTTANVFGSAILDVLDYANTNKNKTLRALTGFDANGSGSIGLQSGAWFSTSAVNSITFFPVFGTSFNQYTQFALYGVK